MDRTNNRCRVRVKQLHSQCLSRKFILHKCNDIGNVPGDRIGIVDTLFLLYYVLYFFSAAIFVSFREYDCSILFCSFFHHQALLQDANRASRRATGRSPPIGCSSTQRQKAKDTFARTAARNLVLARCDDSFRRKLIEISHGRVFLSPQTGVL